jgi:hypothetical protein
VLVVPVNPAGVAVPCSGLMLQCVRHGHSGDALWKMLYPTEDQDKVNEAINGGLSSDVVSRVQLGDGCVVYMCGLLFTVLC